MPMLVGRTLQGLAMGFIPVGISLIREVTPPHDDRDRDRLDERHPRCRRGHRPAALGLGGPGLQLARPVLDVGRAGPARHHRGGRPWSRACGTRSAAASTSSGPSASRSAWSPRWSPSPRATPGAGTTASTLGLLAGGIVVLLVWGWFELRVSRPALRPARHRPGAGAADEPRRGRDRLRDDGPGDRRAPAPPAAVGHGLRARADDPRGRAADGAGRADDDALRPGLQPADPERRRQARR